MRPINKILEHTWAIRNTPDGEIVHYSPMEELVFEENALRGYECERQKPIGKYFADFYYPKNNLVLEVDGRDYHTSEEQKAYDDERNEFMNSLGYVVVRVPGSLIYNDVRNVLAVIQHIPKDKVGVFLIETQNDLVKYWKIIGETL